MVKTLTVDHLNDDIADRVIEKRLLQEILFVVKNDFENLNGWWILCKNRSHSFKRYRYLKRELPNHIVTRVVNDGLYQVRVRDGIQYETV